MTNRKIAERIPHNFREMILLQWYPGATATLSHEGFRMLFEMFFIYVDPDGVKKTGCQKCLNNIFKNWQDMIPYIEEVEKEYHLIERL